MQKLILFLVDIGNFMKNILFVLTILLGANAIAADITWGKKEIFKIDRIIFKDKVYQGALIGSSLQILQSKHGPLLVIKNPGVLVYAINGGFDQVIPLKAWRKSSLCENLGYPFTNLYNADPTNRPFLYKVAIFKSKQEVHIVETKSEYLSNHEISCGPIQIDVTGD